MEGAIVATDIGPRIRQLRKDRGLSQEALGWKAGMEQTDVSKVERGITLPTATKARQLAEALGLDSGEFLSESASS